MFRILTKGLIIKNNSILLLKRKQGTFASGMWDIPGGKLEFGESLEESLIREVYEETALKVNVKGLLGLSSGINFEEKKQYITSLYICKYEGGIVQLNNEHSEYIWVDLDELGYENLVYYVKEAIDKYRSSFLN